ncbi:hypothetical protein ACFQ0M_38530 [Kitasatospora aburaviensis]
MRAEHPQRARQCRGGVAVEQPLGERHRGPDGDGQRRQLALDQHPVEPVGQLREAVGAGLAGEASSPAGCGRWGVHSSIGPCSGMRTWARSGSNSGTVPSRTAAPRPTEQNRAASPRCRIEAATRGSAVPSRRATSRTRAASRESDPVAYSSRSGR